MRGISHVAIGISDMERSLRFYRDLLGLTVTLDKEEPVRGSERLFADPAQNRRRAVYLKWAEGTEAGFVVLSQKPGEPSGRPIKIDQLGIHHFSFWVNDLRERVERLKSAGVKILVGPYESDSIAYGEAAGKKVLTCLFEDPDGIILQFDQRLG
jgi:catechol 2,3-dioxygenase-like lactoylglutathione lyase family enzyme